MGLAARKPKGVIHHSDQGSQYTSVAFEHRCQVMGVRPSMGTALPQVKASSAAHKVCWMVFINWVR
jgi:hypothetical protein